MSKASKAYWLLGALIIAMTIYDEHRKRMTGEYQPPPSNFPYVDKSNTASADDAVSASYTEPHGVVYGAW